MVNTVLGQRRAGILLHLTSLPSTLGLGSLGRHAQRFVDFLSESDLSVWQMLPIHPLHRVPKLTPNRDFLSPYQPMSVFAGNPMLINLQKLVDKRWLPRISFPTYQSANPEQLEAAFKYKRQLLRGAYFRFRKQASPADQQQLQEFIQQESSWLEDYALFCALKEFHSGACWWKWPQPGHRDHDPESLAQFRQHAQHKQYCVEQYYFEQFAFQQQWQSLRKHAHDKGVYLFGDLPFFVARDSVEMWAHRDYFLLNEQGIPRFLSGMPGTNNSNIGGAECWGHPLYDWSNPQLCDWWLKRFEKMHQLFEVIRLTYFRGFHCCWGIHYQGEGTKMDPNAGKWLPVPEEVKFLEVKLRDQLQTHLKTMGIVAEDLGAPGEVIELRNELKFSGIKLLQLGFDLRDQEQCYNPHFPYNHKRFDVVYTGNHDSNTTKGWLENIKKKPEKHEFVRSYLHTDSSGMLEALIRTAFGSVGKLAILPMQDVLGLDETCRMNTLKNRKGSRSWRWQLNWSQVNVELTNKLKSWVDQYDRK